MSTPYELIIDGHHIAVYGLNEHLAGMPVFFIHGITSSINFWLASQTEYIQRSVRWYTLSLPGHYPSRFPDDFRDEDITAESMAALLMQAIDQLEPDTPVILIGHSTGGFSALNIAARWPERVAAVASVSGFAKGRWIGALGILQWLARMGLPGETLFRFQMRLLTSHRALYRAALRAYTKDWAAMYAHPGLEQTLDLIYPDAVNLNLSAMLHYFRRMPDIDITPLLSRISAPTLVMAGDSDPIVSPDQARLIAREVPDAQIHMLPDCGHLPMSERSDEYNRLIQAFVEQQVAKKMLEVAV